MEEVSVEVKKLIVEQKLQAIRNGIYSAVIDKRVAVNVSDKPMEENAVKELTRLEKMKDAYEAELKALEPEEKKAV
jgi:hypothetical protein